MVVLRLGGASIGGVGGYCLLKFEMPKCPNRDSKSALENMNSFRGEDPVGDLNLEVLNLNTVFKPIRSRIHQGLSVEKKSEDRPQNFTMMYRNTERRG